MSDLYLDDDPLVQVRDSLLQLTIDHAFAHAPYYRRVWEGLDLKIGRVEDLARLPLVTKDVLIAHGPELMTCTEMPDYVQMTSGTLHTPTLVHRHRSEATVWAERYAALQKLCGKEKRDLHLRIINPINGIPFVVPDWQAIHFPLVKEKHFQHINELLLRKFQYKDTEDHISVIVSSLERLKLLTQYFLEKKVDYSRFKVSTIMTSATYLSRHWRRTLEESWSAEIIDYFGLSEVRGAGLVGCNSCGGYHPSATGVAEILSLRDNTPIDQGLGILVLTELFPFAQVQPLVRYWTGDIFFVDRACPRTAERRFIFRGRHSQSILVERKGRPVPVIVPSDLVEVFDTLPDIAVEPDRLIGGLLSYDVGHYKWRLDHRRSEGVHLITLHVETRYSPLLLRARTDQIASTIVAELRSANQDFRDAQDDGDVVFAVEFHPPGTLQEAIV